MRDFGAQSRSLDARGLRFTAWIALHGQGSLPGARSRFPGQVCRVDLGVAAQAPHRPGRADFPHPVLRAVVSPDGCPSVRVIQGPCTSSLVSSLLALCCECRVRGVLSLPSGTPHESTVFFPGVSLGSGGSLRPRFATVFATMRTLRQPPRRSLPFRFLHGELTAIPPSVCVSVLTDSCFRRRACRRPGRCSAGGCPFPGFLLAEPCGSPRFLCSLLRLCHALRPRRGTVARPSLATLFRPRAP